MTKGNVLAFFLGILFCIATGSFVKSRMILGSGNAVLIPEETKKQDLPSSQAKLVKMKITAYCPCRKCCGEFADGFTSIGRDAWKTLGVAADPKLLPYGTKLDIPGVGIRTIDDTGGAMRQSAKKGIWHIDVRFHNHNEALQFGVQWLDVKILN